MTNTEIKHIKSLQHKKFRTLNKEFVAEGPKVVSEFMESRFQCVGLYGLSDWVESHEAALADRKIPHQIISIKELGRISGMKTPNAVLAVFSIPENNNNVTIDGDGWTLVLDTIQDPGNLGTILRTAEWFGIDQVICSEDSAELYNPKVVQASMGSMGRVKVHYTSLEDYLSGSGSIPVYGAMMKGKDFFATELPASGLLVIGNESKGISDAVAKFITQQITIPSPGGSAESLNASIATAVLCAEIARQKRLH